MNHHNNGNKVEPPELSEGDIHNFNTLMRAAFNKDVALVSAVRKADQQPVALICAMSHDEEDGQEFLRPVPLAVMVEGNPFELFEDPTV